MSSLDMYSPASHTEAWDAAEDFLSAQERERPQDVVETRTLGPLSMMEVAQGAGSFPDAAAPIFNLQLVVCANCEVEVCYSGHKFHSRTQAGDILFPLSTRIATTLSLHLMHFW
jgi:hypothetical protein